VVTFQAGNPHSPCFCPADPYPSGPTWYYKGLTPFAVKLPYLIWQAYTQVHCYLFGLASLFRGKMIILLMQGMFYEHINMFSGYLPNFLLLFIQCFITESRCTYLISLSNCYLI
jgi:hypothetical protein